MNAGSLTGALTPNRIVSKRLMVGLALAQVLVVLALWSRSTLDALPSPLEVLAAGRTLWLEQGLARAIAQSFAASAQAVGLTVLIGLPLAWATVLPIFRPLVAAVSKGRFLGLTGLTFVFTVGMGGGHGLKLSLLVFGMTVFFVTSMAAEIAAIPRERFEHARTLRMGEWRVAGEVVALGTLDRAFEVLRQNAAIGWTMLTMVEGLTRAEGGVGALLLDQNRHFHLAGVFAIQLAILSVGLVQDAALGALRRFVCPYAELSLERSRS